MTARNFFFSKLLNCRSYRLWLYFLFFVNNTTAILDYTTEYSVVTPKILCFIETNYYPKFISFLKNSRTTKSGDNFYNFIVYEFSCWTYCFSEALKMKSIWTFNCQCNIYQLSLYPLNCRMLFLFKIQSYSSVHILKSFGRQLLGNVIPRTTSEYNTKLFASWIDSRFTQHYKNFTLLIK